MIKKTLLAIFLFMLIAAQIHAQDLRLGPHLAYQKAKDADEGKLMAGAALRLKLSSALGLEGAVNYRQEKYGGGALTVRSWPVMASALIYPLPILHGTIGAGWYNTTLDYDDRRLGLLEVEDKTTQKFGWHFGGGLELPIGGKSRFTADIRYVFIDYDFKTLPGSREVNSDFYMVSAGLLWEL